MTKLFQERMHKHEAALTATLAHSATNALEPEQQLVPAASGSAPRLAASLGNMPRGSMEASLAASQSSAAAPAPRADARGLCAPAVGLAAASAAGGHNGWEPRRGAPQQGSLRFHSSGGPSTSWEAAGAASQPYTGAAGVTPPVAPRYYYSVGQVVTATVRQVSPNTHQSNVAHLLVHPPPGFDGKPQLGCIHASAISHAHVENPSAVFARGDTVRALVVAVGACGETVSLSTKWLEKNPGDMLRDPQAVYAGADEAAAAWRALSLDKVAEKEAAQRSEQAEEKARKAIRAGKKLAQLLAKQQQALGQRQQQQQQRRPQPAQQAQEMHPHAEQKEAEQQQAVGRAASVGSDAVGAAAVAGTAWGAAVLEGAGGELQVQVGSVVTARVLQLEFGGMTAMYGGCMVHLQLLPPYSAGRCGAAFMHGRSISHRSCKDPASVFSPGDVVRALVVGITKGGICHLSTKHLEMERGHMLRDPQAVYARADEAAAAWAGARKADKQKAKQEAKQARKQARAARLAQGCEGK